jgi:catechol 2,3-dioxygenase-like lactoylglutathione lyase family enzyme
MSTASESPEPAAALLEGRTLSVSLTVKDIERSLAWYTGVLGFAVVRRYERDGRARAVALKAGVVEILIGQDDGAKGWDRVKGEGFSFQITTDQNIDEIAQHVVASGGAFDTAPSDLPSGGRFFRVRDPDGFKLTVSSGARRAGAG